MCRLLGRLAVPGGCSELGAGAGESLANRGPATPHVRLWLAVELLSAIRRAQCNEAIDSCQAPRLRNDCKRSERIKIRLDSHENFLKPFTLAALAARGDATGGYCERLRSRGRWQAFLAEEPKEMRRLLACSG